MPDIPNLSPFIAGAGRKTAILDSNLLVLWITSRLGFQLFNHFKRIKSYTYQDALLLNWLISQFKGVATTSYVLAETSNLANELSGILRDAWYKELAAFAVVTDEVHVATKIVGSRNETVRFGIADSALSYLSDRYTLVTAEYRLSGYLEDAGAHVVNFNHLRSLWIFAE